MLLRRPRQRIRTKIEARTQREYLPTTPAKMPAVTSSKHSSTDGQFLRGNKYLTGFALIRHKCTVARIKLCPRRDKREKNFIGELIGYLPKARQMYKNPSLKL